eukprot:CFRG7249T1
MVTEREKMLKSIKEMDHTLVLVSQLREGMRRTLTDLTKVSMWEKSPADFKANLASNTTFVKQTLMQLCNTVGDHHAAIVAADVEKQGNRNLQKKPLPEVMLKSDVVAPLDATAVHNAIVWEKKVYRHTKYAHTMLSNELKEIFPQQAVAIENQLHQMPTSRSKRRRTIASSGRGPTYTPSNSIEHPRQRISDISDSVAWMATWDPKMNIVLYTSQIHERAQTRPTHRVVSTRTSTQNGAVSPTNLSASSTTSTPTTSVHLSTTTPNPTPTLMFTAMPTSPTITPISISTATPAPAPGSSLAPAPAPTPTSTSVTAHTSKPALINITPSPPTLEDNSSFVGLTATVKGVFKASVSFTVLGVCSGGKNASGNDVYVKAGRVCVTGVDENISVWGNSNYLVFRKMTDQANAAILYFTSHKPQAVLSSFLVWLHSYHNLFTEKCSQCDRHLCYDSEEFKYLPPVVRSFTTEQAKHVAYHKQCQYAS